MYCCKEKCFPVTGTQVDGLACFKCESFSFCKCRCITWKNNTVTDKPRKETLILYKTFRLHTCCPESCVKFYLTDILFPKCGVCSTETLCKCILGKCTNRDSWQI